MIAVVSHLRSVVAGTCMVDCNVEEMFINFMLEPKRRPFAEVDLIFLFPTDIFANISIIALCWEKILMGLSSYPHQSTKHMMEVEQIIRGDTISLDNVFG